MASHHFCVGFYSLRDLRFDKEFYDEVLTWFAECQCSPDRICVGPFHKQMRDVKNVKKRIESLDFTKVVSFSLFSLAEGVRHQLEDCKLEVVYSSHFKTIAISGRSNLIAIDEETLHIVDVIVKQFRPEYGIGFFRNFSKGPTSYVHGIGRNEFVSLEDEENCVGWFGYGHDRKVWRHGQIRDVYPWNFLNESQLSSKVGNMTLQQWIEAKPHRGSLQPVAGGLVLWDVPEEDIPAIRPILWKAGIIFDYHPLEEEQLKSAAPLTEQEVLQLILGDRSPGEVHVLKSLGSGKTRELSTEEVKRLAGKSSRKK